MHAHFQADVLVVREDRAHVLHDCLRSTLDEGREHGGHRHPDPEVGHAPVGVLVDVHVVGHQQPAQQLDGHARHGREQEEEGADQAVGHEHLDEVEADHEPVEPGQEDLHELQHEHFHHELDGADESDPVHHVGHGPVLPPALEQLLAPQPCLHLLVGLALGLGEDQALDAGEDVEQEHEGRECQEYEGPEGVTVHDPLVLLDEFQLVHFVDIQFDLVRELEETGHQDDDHDERVEQLLQRPLQFNHFRGSYRLHQLEPHHHEQGGY